MRKVSELTPYDKNAKKHDATQVANVANSIKRFGWQQPIVIDENGVVVIGHCRLMAANKLGLNEVPVTIASGLTEDEIKELRIADNKTNESPWDLNLLAEDIEGLDFDGFDLDFDGLTDGDVQPFDFSALEKQNADLAGTERVNITISVPAECEMAVKQYLSDGGPETAYAMGEAVMKKCGLR